MPQSMYYGRVIVPNGRNTVVKGQHTCSFTAKASAFHSGIAGDTKYHFNDCSARKRPGSGDLGSNANGVVYEVYKQSEFTIEGTLLSAVIQ